MELTALHGIYLVIDPTIARSSLLKKLHAALKGGIRVIQIWNHWSDGVSRTEKLEFIAKVKELASPFEVPVLMHDDWQLAIETDLDGVHFDVVPEDYSEISAALDGKLIGITVGNDMDLIAWAEQQKFSYISFCSMFPSPSAGSCEIVHPEMVIKAREITRLPIFLSGGIRPKNLHTLSQLPFVGIAVISGILNADDPEVAVKQYLEAMRNLSSDNN